MSLRVWKQWGLLNSELLLTFLQDMVETRMRLDGHHIGHWAPAKRKMGKGARRMLCKDCGHMAFVLPYGLHDVSATIGVNAPTIAGDVLTRRCQS